MTDYLYLILWIWHLVVFSMSKAWCISPSALVAVFNILILFLHLRNRRILGCRIEEVWLFLMTFFFICYVNLEPCHFNNYTVSGEVGKQDVEGWRKLLVLHLFFLLLLLLFFCNREHIENCAFYPSILTLQNPIQG
jgi:hypothetical protein